jgi:hypothetical protein
MSICFLQVTVKAITLIEKKQQQENKFPPKNFRPIYFYSAESGTDSGSGLSGHFKHIGI